MDRDNPPRSCLRKRMHFVDKEAWTEEVVQGQIRPDCGATRK